jgi:hypothetical protein
VRLVIVCKGISQKKQTPEQRKAEKAWIDKQRQELVQVKIGIDAILNEQ